MTDFIASTLVFQRSSHLPTLSSAVGSLFAATFGSLLLVGYSVVSAKVQRISPSVSLLRAKANETARPRSCEFSLVHTLYNVHNIIYLVRLHIWKLQKLCAANCSLRKGILIISVSLF